MALYELSINRSNTSCELLEVAAECMPDRAVV